MSAHRRLRSSFVFALLVVVCGCKPSRSADDVEIDDGSGPPPVPREDAREKSARPAMKPEAVPEYEAGMNAFRSGDLAGAVTRFRNALGLDPSAHQIHYALGAALERQGEREAALAEYEASLKLVPDFEPPIAATASLFLRENRIAQAESFLNRQLSRAPESAAALAALAEVKSVQKDSASAQRLAQRALKRSPDYRPAMVVLARDHYRARRLDLALYTLTAILDGYGPENPPRDRDNAEARLIRALIFEEQGQRKAAIDELGRVLALRPDLVEARLHLGAFLLEAGNAQGAVPVLEGALAYEPSNVLVHLNLGDAYRLQGRPDEAIKQLTWVLQADPSLAEAHYDLGLVYLFSKIGGMTEAAAVDLAIREFETYLGMKARRRSGHGDDAEELLSRAKTRKSILEAMGRESAAAPTAPTGATQ